MRRKLAREREVKEEAVARAFPACEDARRTRGGRERVWKIGVKGQEREVVERGSYV